MPRLTEEQQALVLKWQNLAYRIAQSFSHDDEYSSEAMVALCEAVASFDPAKTQFSIRYWISRIVRQALIRFRSRHAARFPSTLTPMGNWDFAVQKPIAIPIHEFISKLPDSLREIAESFWVEKHSKLCIAEATGLSQEHVSQALKRAKRLLFDMIEESTHASSGLLKASVPYGKRSGGVL